MIDSSRKHLSSIKSLAPFYPPLKLGVITAHLRNKGFFVQQDDLNIKSYSKIDSFNLNLLLDKELLGRYIKGKRNDELENNLKTIINQTRLNGFDIFLVSIGDLYLSVAICKKLKEAIDTPIIMVGGDIGNASFPNADKIAKIAVEKKYIDFLIDGQGIEPLFLLLKSLRRKITFEDVPGLIYFKNKKIIRNSHGKPTKPIKPDFKGLPLEKYVWHNKDFRVKGIPANEKISILPFKFIEGCPNSCIFCMDSTSKAVYLSPQKVVMYLKELSEEYATKYFYFLNCLINPTKSYINKLCDLIIKNNLDIYWMDFACFNNLDKETIIKMKKAGCVSLTLGLETGSQRLLNYTEKGLKLKHTTNVINWLNEAGIWVRIEIICGLPPETDSDIKKTILYLNKNKHLIDRIEFFRFSLSDTSRLFTESKKYGLNNIRKIYSNEQRTNFSNPYGYRYDLNGTRWEKLVKKIEHSYWVTKLKSPNTIDISDFEQNPFLFLLYSNFNDKAKIKKIYKKTMISLAMKYSIINTIKNPKKILKLYEEFGLQELKIKVRMLINNLR